MLGGGRSMPILATSPKLVILVVVNVAAVLAHRAVPKNSNRQVTNNHNLEEEKTRRNNKISHEKLNLFLKAP